MPRIFKQILILFSFWFVYLFSPFILKAQYDPPPSIPPNPPPGSCDQGACPFGCQCGSFFCDAEGWDTYICCSPDCPGGTSPNRSCIQEPACDNPNPCNTADDCQADPDYYHQCGDLSNASCSVFPHCDYGRCSFECRCGDSGDGGDDPPPVVNKPSFDCTQPVSWPADQLTDDTGQDSSCQENTKDFVLTVSDSDGIDNLKTVWFGLWPDIFPESAGPDDGVSPTKYAFCGEATGDNYKDEPHLIDNYTTGWDDTGRPGFFGVEIWPDDADPGNSAIFYVSNNSAPGCPWGASATSGDLSNTAGTATLIGINDNISPRNTFIEPVDANTIKIHLRIRFTGEFAYHGSWKTFAMARDDEDHYQYGHSPQWEETDCGLTCATFLPNEPSLVSPADGQSITSCGSSVFFDWDEPSCWGTDCEGNSGDDKYNLYVGTSPVDLDNADNLQCSRERGGTTSCTVNIADLSLGTNYWTVVANNGVGDSSIPSPRSFTISNVPPSAPNLISPGGALPGPHETNNNELSLQWNNNIDWGCNLPANNNHFYVNYKNDSGEDYDWGNPICSVSSASSTCGPFTFEWDTTYYWQVRASNNGPNFSPFTPNTYADSVEWTFIPHHSAWWQVKGGDIYAENDINDVLPDQDAYLMVNSTEGKHGSAIYGDSIDLGSYCNGSDCVPDNVAGDTDDWDANSTYNGDTYNYAWWVNHFKDEDKEDENYGGGAKPSESGIYLAPNSINTSANWNIGTDRVIVLVSGDFNIDDNIIVDKGGFLMVVASGKITVSDSIGETAGGPDLTGTTANIQGVFIADEIDTGSGSLHLWLAGTFVGWDSVDISRDIGGAYNGSEPSTTFIFRPDFLLNAPDSVKKVNFLRWQQVPG